MKCIIGRRDLDVGGVWGEKPMRFYRLLLGALAVWRITHLLNAEDGPGEVFVRLRRLAGEGFWGQLLDCFYCLSVWIAAPLAVLLARKPLERFLMWPALSAGAILLQSVIDSEHDQAPVVFVEDREDEHAVLR
jgi:hypothetical protein